MQRRHRGHRGATARASAVADGGPGGHPTGVRRDRVAQLRRLGVDDGGEVLDHRHRVLQAEVLGGLDEHVLDGVAVLDVDVERTGVAGDRDLCHDSVLQGMFGPALLPIPN
ncbi:MAG: hypothetical protein JWP06_167 [Candidatus Saccharibacteria bacterium]|nr:hypothetical protein [Candidatus Saccharibacteria bacterium]